MNTLDSSTDTGPRVLRPYVVREKTGLSEPTIWRLRQRGDFPTPIRLTARLIGYRAEEIEAWLAARARA